LGVKPASNPQHYLQQAMQLHQAGEIDRAMQMYRDVLAKEPGQADALHLLGAAHWQKGELDEGEKLIRRAIKIWDKSAGYFADLGGVLKQRGELVAAIAEYKKALALDPNLANARKGLAESLGRHGHDLAKEFQWEESEAAYRQYLEMRPGDAGALNNLAEIYHHAGDRETALSLYNEALQAQPGLHIARFNRAICLLGMNRLKEGWADMEASKSDWINRMDKRKGLPWLALPLWDGSDLCGKKILIWGDQGIGDEVLYAGMFSDLLACGAQVTVECMDRLVPIFARSFPEITVMVRSTHIMMSADFDFHSPYMWLSRFFRHDFAQFPARRGYLKADPEKTEMLRARYRAYGKPRIVGISWHTSTGGRGTARRMSLLDLAKVLPKDRLYVDLQYGDTAAERTEAARALPDFVLHHDTDVDQLKDMDIYAAQVVACDEVVTIGNTTAHMAGSLGIPSQVFLPIAGLTWFWFEKLEKCPWYPSVRLLRKEQEGDWDAALGKVKD